MFNNLRRIVIEILKQQTPQLWRFIMFTEEVKRGNMSLIVAL